MPTSSASPRPGVILAAASLAAAVGWLLAKVRLGLDFTDEMQYYGEIASLVRTGKFFQDDLFLQQLGYLWVWPFFKLHAALFPDQSYLVLFGRALCVGAYAATGWLLWRILARDGGFGLPARLTALAVFAAWIPFQLLAFSYNSLAYLCLVALVALWFGRRQIEPGRRRLATAALLTLLTYSYPPAGLAMIPLAVGELALREGRGPALRLLGLTAGGGAAAAGVIFATHGFGFVSDALVSLRFSGGFSGGQMFRNPLQIGQLLLLLAGAGSLVLRLRQRTGWVAAGAVPSPGFVAVAGVGCLLLLGLAAGYFRAGYFVPLWFGAALFILALLVRPDDDARAGDLAAFGVLLAAVFAISGGDGFLNASTGLAAVLPFLALCVAQQVADRTAGRLPALLAVSVGPAAAVALLLNGATHPYRDQRGFAGFGPVEGIPAFAGLLLSPTKLETVQRLRELTPPQSWRGRRLFVAGPHPWLYFATGATPATCMFFLHFTADPDKEDIYDLIAERMFKDGEPDAVILTNQVPPAIGRRILQWAEAGKSEHGVLLPVGFIRRHRREMEYEFGGQLILLTRTPRASAAPATP